MVMAPKCKVCGASHFGLAHVWPKDPAKPYSGPGAVSAAGLEHLIQTAPNKAAADHIRKHGARVVDGDDFKANMHAHIDAKQAEARDVEGLLARIAALEAELAPHRARVAANTERMRLRRAAGKT